MDQPPKVTIATRLDAIVTAQEGIDIFTSIKMLEICARNMDIHVTPLHLVISIGKEAIHISANIQLTFKERQSLEKKLTKIFKAYFNHELVFSLYYGE